MFTTLLETSPTRSRTRSAAVFSLVIHVALAGTAVAATKTAIAKDPIEEIRHDVIFVPPTPKPITPQPARPLTPETPRPVTTDPLPAPTPPIVAPTDIPNTIPPVNPFATPTQEPVFGSGRPLGDGIIDGAGDPTGPINGTYTGDEVEEQVQPIGRQRSPRYPDMLRSSQIEGAVTVVYVVDSLGRVEPESFKVIESSHALFDPSVRQAVLGQRFRPAKWRGHTVRQLVQQRFVFALSK